MLTTIWMTFDLRGWFLKLFQLSLLDNTSLEKWPFHQGSGCQR
jgi:hypothetical protein